MCIDGINAEEAAVQGLYGCWRDLYLAVWQLYQLTDDSWQPAGFYDACNVALPFAKVVNGVFLIHYTLTDNYSLQWHSTEDYTTESEAVGSRFHNEFYMRFIEYNGSSEADSDTGRFLAEDRTNLHCPIFDMRNPSNSVGNRASVLIHEAWHHWQNDHGWQTSHPQCGSPSHDCDYFYFHRISDFDFGQLDAVNLDPIHLLFHSPYQVQCEFDADLAELAQPWVPAVVTQAARAIGNARLSSQFVNNPPWRIGNPRPW
jgi:hypothetical protein